MKKVIVVGGSGFIGSALIEALLAKGYYVVNIDLRKSKRVEDASLYKEYILDITKDIFNQEIFAGSYGVINLAGIPIFGRFSKKYKKSIYDSRIDTTRRLVTIFSNIEKPQVFISTSAIGYYGDTKGVIVDEKATSSSDFLGMVCRDWEHEALQAEELGIRTVILRNAHVIGKGGLARVLITLLKKYIGGYFGHGRQHMPWVSIEDIVRLYIHSLENTSVRGVYNTSPGAITQKELLHRLAKKVSISVVWSIPVFFARIMYLSFADSLMTDVQVDSKKIIDTGFVFEVTQFENTCVE